MKTPRQEILVVEDNPETLAWLVEVLTSEGVQVRPANSGALALASARLHPPELVLLDVGMGDLDGLEVCRRLKADPTTQETPVLFLSGLAAVEDRVRGYQAGALDYLVKPLQKDDLLARVRTFLQLSEARRSLKLQTLEIERIQDRLEEEIVLRFGAQALLDEAPSLVYALDLEGHLLLANKALLRAVGKDPEVVLGKTREAFLPDEIAAIHRANDQKVLESGASLAFEERNLEPDGEHLYWSVKFPIKNLKGEVVGLGGISSDLSGQRRLEADRTRLSALLETRSQANQAMLKASSEADLFQHICQICVEFGGFDLAWVATRQAECILPSASAGPATGYLDGLEITANPADALSHGPTGQAFLNGQPVLCQDWRLEPGMKPWREQGTPFGLRASAAFPVGTRVGVEAVLNLYSRTPNAFPEDRAALLEELAHDLAFAMDKFREERQHLAAEASLREEQRRYLDLVNSQPAGIYRLWTPQVALSNGQEWEALHVAQYRVEFVSNRFCDIAGLAPETFRADPAAILERLHPEDRAEFSERNAAAFTQLIPFYWEGRLKGPGSPRWVRFESTPRVLSEGGVLWTGILSDISEQKAAHELIERQHALLRGILESSQDPVFSVDRACCYTSYNHAHASAVKALYGQDIALGGSVLEVPTVAEDRRRTRLNLERALAGAVLVEESFSGDEAFCRRYFEITHTPIRDRYGAVSGVAVFARDITERKHNEEQHRRLMDLLRHSEALAKVGGWEIDLETGTVFWSKEIYAIHELDPEAYQPTVASSIQFYAPESRPVITQAVAEAIRTGTNFDLELDLITGRGRRIHVHATSELVYRDGRAVKLLGAFQDITELTRTRERYRLLTENMRDVVWTLDTETLRFTYVSPSVTLLRGYTPEEVLAEPMDAAFSAEGAHLVRALMHQRAATVKAGAEEALTYHVEEVEQPCKDGSMVWTEVVTSDYLDRDSGHVFVLGVSRNIAERKRLEIRLQALNEVLESRVRERTEQLETANQELEAFAYSVSHDLRAPLRAISGFSEIVLQQPSGGLKEETLNYLQRIHANAERMSQLIDDLLLLSRVGRDELLVLPLNLAHLSREVFTQLQEREPTRQVALKIPADLPTQGDPRLLRVLMENLIGNAWKFTSRQADAVIEVGLAPGDPPTLFVKDDGVGFSMAQAGKLFMPFQRLHKPSEFPGSGIGLAIAKRVVARHGGRIWAQSEPGQGATFFFRLPTQLQSAP